MARFIFSANPTLNQETFIGSLKYKWNGFAWDREQFDLNTLLSNLKDETVTETSAAIVSTAPEALDTINELATALGNDSNFSTTVTTALGTKADAATVTSSLATKVDKTKSIDEVTNNYTLVLDDAATILNCTNSSAITITIPLQAIVAFPVGSEIAFIRKGTGAVTIAGSVGVTVSSADSKFKIKGQYGTAAVLKVAADEWVLAGSLEA